MNTVLMYIFGAIWLFLIGYTIYNLIKLAILSVQIYRDEKELKKLYKELAELQEKRAKLEAKLKELG